MMSQKTLRFEKIKIDKMPGLRNGLKAYENLSPHINIIAGPNASGKSSTARAIHQLLWKNGTERISANGTFTIEKESWFSEVDATTLRFQREGSPAELKGIPSGDDQSRYMLSLHELIRKEDKNLAESILKDAIGGYDIDQAKRKLGYNDTKKSTNTNQSREYRTARGTLNEIEDQQKKLQADEEKLKGLEKEKKDAAEAAELASFYGLALELKKKKDRLSAIQEKLSEFPDSMQRVNGEDYTNFDELTKEIQKCEGTLAELDSVIKTRKEEKAALKLPKDGIDPLDLTKAAGYVEKIEELEKEISRSEQETERAKSDLKQAARRLELDDNEAQFEGLSADSVSLMDEFWQKAFDQYGTVRLLHKEVEKLNDEQQDAAESEKLRLGISELAKWLSSYGSPGKPVTGMYLILIIAIAIGSVAAAHFLGTVGYIGIALIAVVLYLIYRDRNAGSDSQTSMREADFSRTGLRAPATWDAEHVASRVNELVEELTHSRHQEKLKERLTQLKRELNEETNTLEKVHVKGDELKEQIGVIPGLDENKLKNYSSLYWHLNHALEWDNARKRIVAEEQVVLKAKEEITRWLDKLNTIFKTYGLESVSSFADAKAGRDHLQELRERFNELSRTIETAESNRQRTLADRKKAKENLQKICDRLEVTPEDAFGVKELVERLDAFTELKNDENQALVLLNEARTKLEASGPFESEKHKIQEYTIEQIASEMEQFEQEAEMLNDIQRQITEIETMVKAIKQKSDLEQALVREENALMNLEELYKENAGSIIGDLLVKHLQSDMGEKNMPEVFERARDLFKRITRNRYELIVHSDGDEAGFRANDLLDGTGKSLQELSTGTRIQLIMSVRLAFIEKAENEIKLPLLADELLANSDSQRAGAIIDALIEISREGRQIFYFTAQEDEVSKWEHKLKESQMEEYRVYVIDEGEDSLPVTAQVPVFEGIQLHREIPEPGAMSYDEYGAALRVPALRNLFTPAEQLHIWYFLDDTKLLHSIMKSGIENPGMLKSYFRDEGIIEGLDDETRETIEKRISLTERYLELRRFGRSNSIDREVLEKSGAVSPNFIDDVSDKLKEVGYDPAELLTALQNGEVAGFRNNKRESLNEYLINNGYIQQVAPHSKEEIRTKMMAYISNTGLDAQEAQKVLDRLMGSKNL